MNTKRLKLLVAIVQLAVIAAVWADYARGQSSIRIAPDNVKRVATVAALATATPKDGDVVLLEGYYASQDGGGQMLVYDRDSSATVNSGFVFNGPGSVGRYLATDQNTANLKRFGATVDDATDDTDKIQAALGSGASVVYAPTGEYTITSALIPPADIEIRGDGMYSTIIKQTNVTFGTPATYYGAFMCSSARVHFRDLAIVGENNPVQEMALGIAAQGIEMVEGGIATDVVIERCRFEYIFGHGVLNAGSVVPRTTVRHCVASNNGKNGLNICGTRHVLTDNICDNNKYQGIESAVDHTIVSRNRCRGNDAGISIGGDTSVNAFRPNNVITDNICDENSINGISISTGTHYSTFRGNHCRNNSQSGIAIVENYVSPAYARYNIIAENICLSNGLTATPGYGILVGAFYNTLSGNICKDISDAGYAQQNGIRVNTGISNVDLIDNECLNNTVVDYSIASCTDIVFKRLHPESTFTATGSTFIGAHFDDATAQPAPLTADVSDYNPTRSAVWRLSSDATRSIFSIAGGSDGRTIRIINDGTNNILLQNETGATGQNRIITGTNFALTIAPKEIVDLFYDGTESRWRVVNSYLSNALLRLSVVTTAVGNVTIGEDQLQPFVMVGSTLNTIGHAVRITAWGTAANNANVKTLRLYFGTEAISAQTLTVNEALTWEFSALVLLTGASTQDYKVAFREEGTTEQHDIDIGSVTQNNASNISIRCTGEATATNDIVQEGLLVELIR